MRMDGCTIRQFILAVPSIPLNLFHHQSVNIQDSNNSNRSTNHVLFRKKSQCPQLTLWRNHGRISPGFILLWRTSDGKETAHNPLTLGVSSSFCKNDYVNWREISLDYKKLIRGDEKQRGKVDEIRSQHLLTFDYSHKLGGTKVQKPSMTESTGIIIERI